MSLNETINNLGDSIINLVDKKRRGTLGLEQGDVGYDKEVFEDIRKYKHSTFDKSKFTVVGSPNITEDGVASGFSGSDGNPTNAIYFNKTLNSTSGKIVVICNATYKNSSYAQTIFSGGAYGASSLRMEVYAHGIAFRDASNTQIIWMNTSEHLGGSLIDGDILDFTLTLNGTNVSLTVIKNNTVQSTLTASMVEFNYSTWYVGSRYSTAYSWGGSIDLKQFSITVDGKEVFNGNRIGLDVIKPDNYTVVGSPVISADGVASGFSASNLINSTITLSQLQGKSWKLTGRMYADNTNYAPVFGFSPNKVAHSRGILVYSASNPQIQFIGMFGVSGATSQEGQGIHLRLSSTPQKYIDVSLEFNYNTGIYTLTSVIDDMTTQTATYTPTTANKELYLISSAPTQVLKIGHCGYYNSNDYYANGSIDLNAFKIYVDGNLVYQPCLKIPYNESKTGSKIVPAYARNRVIDLYEQEGYTGYYTIQEGKKDNYTVVGSPTIVNGVASGFSIGNYIKKDITLRANNSIEYEFVVKLPHTTYATNRAIFNPISTSNDFLAFIYTNNGYVTFNGFGGDNREIKLGGTYKIRMSTYSNGTFALNWTDISTGVQGSKTGTNACYSTVNNTLLTITLGLTLANVPQFPFVGEGSIDLNSFKIYVDGKLAYQTFIPPNYTLPMGDVYGVLSAKSNSSEISKYAMPSEIYYDLTPGANETYYTAPANGWVLCSGYKLAAGPCEVALCAYNVGNGLYSSVASQALGAGWGTGAAMLPIKKGELFTVMWNSDFSIDISGALLRFYYTEGSKGEKQ